MSEVKSTKGRPSPYTGKKIAHEIGKAKGAYKLPVDEKGKPVVAGQLATIAAVVLAAKGKKVDTILGQSVQVAGKDGALKDVKLGSSHIAALVEKKIITLV